MSTEKRLFLFLALTFVILSGYSIVLEFYGPKPPPEADAPIPPAVAKDDSGKETPATPETDPASSKTADSTKPAAPTGESTPVTSPNSPAVFPHRVVTLGSYEPGSGGSPLLVTLNSRGGTLERVELVERTASGTLRYRDLDHPGGYLGALSLVPERPRGCRVQVVPPGSPAARAKSGAETGLQPGDLLTQVEGRAIETPADVDGLLSQRHAGDSVKLTVERNRDGSRQVLEFQATLAVRPFPLIRSEPLESGELIPHPDSLQIALRNGEEDQSAFTRGLQQVDWETRVLDQPVPTVEFRYAVTPEQAKNWNLGGPVEVLKRFRLGTAGSADTTALAHHLDFELELKNLDQAQRSVAYRLDGTNGLPTEGWWYLTKIHTRWFQSAGARDVVIRTDSDGHRLVGSSAILSRSMSEEESPQLPLFSEKEPEANRSLSYVGVDTQYFAAALLPISAQKDTRAVFARCEAMVQGDPTKKPKGWERTANTTFQLTSQPVGLDPGQAVTQKFQLFLGPKSPDVLARYQLDECIYYGWFGWIARLLSSVLHVFYAVVGNYGVAIVMLTVLVRSCMFPISRTAARNAAMMQELAPEMRKIAEKYKNNLEARGKAQQELFRSHNYNPLSGCWLMFLQLPVFIGLYRCLAIDIELRQAPLLSGLEWCSNLAGPDKLFFWKSDFLSYFTDESGWLGPYFNVLPIFTIGLFLLHQKLFTPPATDEQTEMQLKMMKFMTVFMGVMFYKVPAGLCLYFITSSLWGIAERKLLKNVTPAKKPDEIGPRKESGFSWSSLLKPEAPTAPDNGQARKKELERKLRNKK